MGITLTNACMKRMDWFRVGRDLFRGGRTGFSWFQGGKDWFWLVLGWEGLVSAGFGWFRGGRTGFGSFRFLVTTSREVGLGKDLIF